MIGWRSRWYLCVLADSAYVLEGQIEGRFMVRLTRCAIPVLTFVGLALGISIPGNAAQHKSFTPEQKDAIEEIVRDYILNNPEVIVESLQKLERRRKLSEAQRSRAQLQARKQDIRPGFSRGGKPERRRDGGRVL